MTVRELVADLVDEHLDRLTGDPVRLQTLIALLDDLGVSEPTSRVALAGLRQEGSLLASRTGRETRYLPTDRLRADRRRQEERMAGRLQRWDGCWRMVIYTVPETRRATRERFRRTLGRHGFGMLAPSTWISPHEIALEEVRTELAAEPAARVEVLRAQPSATGHPGTDRWDADRGLAHRCWDLRGLAAGYRELADVFDRQLDRPLPRGAAALRAHLDAVLVFRATAGADPFLPAELLPPDWPGQQACDAWGALIGRLAEPAREHVAARLAQTRTRNHESVRVISPVRREEPSGR